MTAWLVPLIAGYLIAGASHMARLLRAAHVIRKGPHPALRAHGEILWAGLLHQGPVLFTKVVLSWPLAIFNYLRSPSRGRLNVLLEPAIFVVAWWVLSR